MLKVPSTSFASCEWRALLRVHPPLLSTLFISMLAGLTGGCSAIILQQTTTIIVAYCTGLLEFFMLHKLKRYFQVALVYEGLLLLLINAISVIVDLECIPGSRSVLCLHTTDAHYQL